MKGLRKRVMDLLLVLILLAATLTVVPFDLLHL